MNRNIRIIIGLSLASVAVAAILLVCKKCTCACCEDSNPTKEKCCDTKEQETLQE
jgi:hypothetical protein